MKPSSLRLAAVLVGIGLLGCGRRQTPTPPAPKPVASVPPAEAQPEDAIELRRASTPLPTSRYGRFDIVVDAEENCIGRFEWEHEASPTLFLVPRCGGEVPGMNTLGAPREHANTAFPVVAENGDEFHLFALSSMRGGNWSADTDYWVVVVRAHEAWSAELSSGDLSVLRADKEGSSIELEQPSTTTREGLRCRVAFGRLHTEKLPVNESHIVRKSARIVAGKVQGGSHATEWHPILNPDTDALIIDDDEGCVLPGIGEGPSDMRLKLQTSTWSDGRKSVRCVEVLR